eukprot:scaffold60_cov382-Prasinococcus_capsulatus_cf.AAC.3
MVSWRPLEGNTFCGELDSGPAAWLPNRALQCRSSRRASPSVCRRQQRNASSNRLFRPLQSGHRSGARPAYIPSRRTRPLLPKIHVACAPGRDARAAQTSQDAIATGKCTLRLRGASRGEPKDTLTSTVIHVFRLAACQHKSPHRVSIRAPARGADSGGPLPGLKGHAAAMTGSRRRCDYLQVDPAPWDGSGVLHELVRRCAGC